MHEIPECLNRRYRALDDLIRELSTAMSPRGSLAEWPAERPNETNAGIRLMCDFWNILQENPDCDLAQEVQERMNVPPKQSRIFRPQNITCYMASKCSSSDEGNKRKSPGKSACCQSGTPNMEPKRRSSCCASRSGTPSGSEAMPLSKVLCNLKDAASFEKKCSAKVNELMETQKELKDQIQQLENKEKEGVELLKKADCMWSCMEDSYKTKVAEALDRQKLLTAQMKEVEASATKWRKNKKDVEFQLANVQKCHEEISEKYNQKMNDMKLMDSEIEDLKKRIENAKKDSATAKNSLSTRRTSCDVRVAKIIQEISKVQKQLADEMKRKTEKEQEGNGYVKEARDDLQKMCRVLMKKKIENEDLLAERYALLQEIELLNQTADQCKDKCANKQTTLTNEIKKIDQEIANYKVKCLRCHQCTDTTDARRLCSDCPRCKQDRECLDEVDHCSVDHTMDCVCISVKQKFLDNVFDNMYTVLARQARTGPGKAVAEAVLNCLKKSRNGKLDEDTKRILQDFILSTVKKNLNLTIVGGAVKTRCEMDAETYKQLMLCLKLVKVTPPPKADKGTVPKKDPCFRWGGTSECNCPKGPKACICTKKAPPPPRDPTPCPPPDKEDTAAQQEATVCPHKESASCGPDCAMRAVPSSAGADPAVWRPDPCKGPTCQFSKNMRAAQCVLGPESLSSLPKGRATVPYVPEMLVTDDTKTCTCGNFAVKPCPCCKDGRCRPRQRIIDEVLGRYTEITPIEKVNIVDDSEMATGASKEESGDSIVIELVTSDTSLNVVERCCSCNINSELPDHHKTPIKVTKKAPVRICKNIRKNIVLGGLRNTKTLSKNENDVNVILCPKFTPFFKANKATLASSAILAFEDSKPKINLVIQKENCSLDSYDASCVGRKVCDTVRELMKDIVVPDSDMKFMLTASPNSEWVTVESLYKEIEQLTKSEPPSETTLNEIEINCEPLEASKALTKKQSVKIIHSCDKIVSNIPKSDINNKDPVKKNKFSENTKNKVNIDVSEDTKQMKAEIVQRLDKGTCISCQITTVVSDYANEWSSSTGILKGKHVYEEIKHENYQNLAMKHQDHIDDSGTQPEITHIRVTIQSENGQLNNYFTDLTRTSSGSLAMELDEQAVKDIENKLRNDPTTFLSLKETATGHKCIYFNTKEKETKNTQKVVLRKTSSGNNFFYIRKSIIKILKPRSVDVKSPIPKKGSPLPPRMDKLVKDIEYQMELNHFYAHGGRAIVIKMKKGDTISVKENVALIKTSVGNITMNLKNISSVPDVNFPNQLPIFLSKSASGTYLLDIACNQPPNAILKSTASESILLDFTDDSNTTTDTLRSEQISEEFFKVKVKCSSIDMTELPAVLKTLDSENYVIVPDKEFEKLYKQTVQAHIGHNTECYVNLSKIDSETFVIELYDTENASTEHANAFLVMSSSGSIKIHVKGSVLQKMHKLQSSIDSVKAFGELINKLPASSREFHREKLRKSKVLGKSISDSNLYEKDMFSRSSIELKKTTSGKYAVVLNKESKKRFINNLKSFISVNSEDVIPICRTESGEITINLNHRVKNTGFYGSLKITPSGNIYVMVDENIIIDIVKKDAENSVSFNSADTGCFIGTLQEPVNKAVATTCNAKPDNCSCDTSKCVCKDLTLERKEWFYRPDEHESVIFPVEKNKNWNVAVSDSILIKTKFKSTTSANMGSHANVKLPHIVIKPNTRTNNNANNLSSTAQCYFVFETMCPFHKDRYKEVSNEILEITGLCGQIEQNITDTSEGQIEQNITDNSEGQIEQNITGNSEYTDTEKVQGIRGCAMDNSLAFLPHQLPFFLNDIVSG